jgi:hypothetical protein
MLLCKMLVNIHCIFNLSILLGTITGECEFNMDRDLQSDNVFGK